MTKYLPKIVGFLLNILSFFSSKSAAKFALKLFSVPRKGQITQEQAVFLETASKEVFLYEKNKIMAYKWTGTKDTILLVHGWESNAGRWMDLISDLQKKDFTIIALDAPAHGNSGSHIFNVILYTEYINTVANAFNPNTIVAHSLGGISTALFMSKYRTTSIEKLILTGVPCKYTDVISRYTHMMGYNKRTILKLNNIITERFGIPPESLSTAKNLENSTAKGLIIHDKEDDIIPYNDALLIKNSLKNSKLITTKGFGHSLKDKSISSQILKFIDT